MIGTMSASSKGASLFITGRAQVYGLWLHTSRASPSNPQNWIHSATIATKSCLHCHGWISLQHGNLFLKHLILLPFFSGAQLGVRHLFHVNSHAGRTRTMLSSLVQQFVNTIGHLGCGASAQGSSNLGITTSTDLFLGIDCHQLI